MSRGRRQSREQISLDGHAGASVAAIAREHTRGHTQASNHDTLQLARSQYSIGCHYSVVAYAHTLVAALVLRPHVPGRTTWLKRQLHRAR